MQDGNRIPKERLTDILGVFNTLQKWNFTRDHSVIGLRTPNAQILLCKFFKYKHSKYH